MYLKKKALLGRGLFILLVGIIACTGCSLSLSAPDSEAEEIECLADFETVARWRVHKGECTIEADRAQSIEGKQSLRLTIPEGEDCYIRMDFRENLISAPVDLSGYSLAVQYMLQRGEIELMSFYYVTGDRMTDLYYGAGLVDTCGNDTGRWMTSASHVPANFDADGNPRWDSIKTLAIRVKAEAGSGDVVINFDNWIMLPLSPECMITFIFDDGFSTDFTVAHGIMSEYGYAGVSFVITETIGNDGRLTIEQLQTMESDGWDIGSHTLTHPWLEDLDETAQTLEVVKSKEQLIECGLERGSRFFCAPHGTNSYVSHVTDVIGEHYLLATAGGGFATLPVLNRAHVPRIAWDGTTLEDIRSYIDVAAEDRLWLIFAAHSMTGDDVTKFEETVDYVHEMGIRVVTLSEVVDSMDWVYPPMS